MTAITNTTYKEITATLIPLENEYQIVPFDINGNLLNEITLIVDSTLSYVNISLPKIESLNRNWNLKINVVALTGVTFPVNIIAFDGLGGTNRIGSSYVKNLTTNGANCEISPIGEENWSATVTL